MVNKKKKIQQKWENEQNAKLEKRKQIRYEFPNGYDSFGGIMLTGFFCNWCFYLMAI